jgi:hypothetical protein
VTAQLPVTGTEDARRRNTDTRNAGRYNVTDVLHQRPVNRVLIMGVEKPAEKCGRLGTSQSRTLVLKREDGGKIRVASMLWPEPKVILRREVLEVRNVDGRLHVARKPRYSD